MTTLVRTLRLTDAFTWEDLPHTDPDTGYLAMVAWIPRIRRVTTFITWVAIIIYVIQNLMLYFASDDYHMVFPTWYPFDTTESPAYGLVYITQVTVCVCVVEYCSTAFIILHGAESSLQQKRTIR
jgi:hypothetical protein